MKIEKIPDLLCNKCGSSYVIKTKSDVECDNCGQITAQQSDYIKHQKEKQNLTLKFMEIK